jgi:copper chaperone CopZ
MSAMMTTTYTVSGMTCGHCVSAVSSEVGKLAGVTEVQVDLTSGAVSVTSEVPLDDAAVAAAVGEAGYQLSAR